MDGLAGWMLVAILGACVALAFVAIWLVRLRWRVFRLGRSDLGSRAMKVLGEGRVGSIVSFQGFGGVPCVLVGARCPAGDGDVEVTFMGEGTHDLAPIEGFGAVLSEFGVMCEGPRYRRRGGEEVADFLIRGEVDPAVMGRVVEAALDCVGVAKGALIVSTLHPGQQEALPAA